MSTVSNTIPTDSKWGLFDALNKNNLKVKKKEKFYEWTTARFIVLDTSSSLEEKEIKKLSELLNTDELIDLLESGKLTVTSKVFDPFCVRLCVCEEFIDKKRSKELTETHIQKLSEYLEHEEYDVRRRSVDILYNIPKNYVADEKLIQRCIDLSRDKNEFVTIGAANVLARIMKNQGLGKHIEQIVENLSDGDFRVRMIACYFFRQIASVFPADSDLFERVTKRLSALQIGDDIWYMTYIARPALEKIWKKQGSQYVELIDRHIKSLEELGYSEDYLFTIAENQRLNESHIKRLKELLDHPDYRVQEKAAKILSEVALNQENNEELVQVFKKKLKSGDELVRKIAKNCLLFLQYSKTFMKQRK